jgi:hypothetical protein
MDHRSDRRITNFAPGFPHFCVSMAYERRFTSTPSRKPGQIAL